MPQMLGSLRVNEISLVDRGSNPGAKVALFKRDTPDDVTKYHPDQARDKGTWSDGGAGEKSEAANKLTTDAKTPGDHQAAGVAHGIAAQFHRVAAASADKVGHAKAADDHSKLAGLHDVKAISHYQQSIAEKSDKGEAMETWDENDPICKAVEYVGKAGGQTVDGVEFGASDFAFVPDPAHSSTWKLRLTSKPGGTPDPAIVGAAAAALGPGFRGKKVQIPESALPDVKARVRAAWHKANPDKGDDQLPEVLRKGEGVSMSHLEELEARVTKQDADNAALQAQIAVLKAENEVILKMGKKEKKAFGAMSEEKRKAYMAADDAKRKSMMDEECKGMTGEPDEDDMEKRVAKIEADSTQKVTVLADQVAKSSTEIQILKAENAEIRKRERLVIFTKRAEDELPHTPGTPVEKGEMLMTLADTLGGEDGKVFKQVFGNLKAADELMKPLFREIGKHGGGEGSALNALQAKADEIQKRENINKHAAYGKALMENPKLYEQAEAERLAAV